MVMDKPRLAKMSLRKDPSAYQAEADSYLELYFKGWRKHAVRKDAKQGLGLALYRAYLEGRRSGIDEVINMVQDLPDSQTRL